MQVIHGRHQQTIAKVNNPFMGILFGQSLIRIHYVAIVSDNYIPVLQHFKRFRRRGEQNVRSVDFHDY